MGSGTDSNIIIFLMVAIILFFIYYKQTVKNSAVTNGSSINSEEDLEHFEDDDDYEYRYNRHRSNSKYRKHHNSSKHTDMSNIVSTLSKTRRRHSRGSKGLRDTNPVVNAEFVEMQYNVDYNDTITGINDLTPQKELFNLGFLPVRYTTPDPENVESLVKLFMNKLNNQIVNNVQEYLNVNSGWSDMGKRRREKSGFETQMEELGLPGSLYNEPAAKAPIRLVKIDKAEQQNTDNQIRFVIYIIVQKENVEDQMVLQVQFFMEREDLSGDRDDRANFFTRGNKNEEGDIDPELDVDQSVIIEQVFILGYLTSKAKPKTKMDDFHNYDGIHREDGTIDQEKVIKMMLKKHKERQNELNSFMCTLDDDTKEIHDVPNIDNYSQYKNTRTIMDDLAKFPQRSFGDVHL